MSLSLEWVDNRTRVGDLTVVTIRRADGPPYVQVQKRGPDIVAAVTAPAVARTLEEAAAIHVDMAERLRAALVPLEAIREATVLRALVERLDRDALAEELARFVGAPLSTGEDIAGQLIDLLESDAQVFHITRLEVQRPEPGGLGDVPFYWKATP